MKINGLSVGILALCAITGGVYWTKQHKAEEANKPPTNPNSDSAKVLTIPQDQIVEVRLSKQGGETTTVSKTGDRWSITAPKALPADQDTVSTMVGTLASLEADRVVDDKSENLARFGLAEPKEKVEITKKDGKIVALELGNDSPVGTGVYAKVSGDPRVFLLNTSAKGSVDKNSKDLRDKRLLTFNSDKLTSLQINAKGQTFEFGKNAQNEWSIVKPKPLRADGSLVDDIVRKLKDAKMDTSVSDEEAKKAAAAFAGAARVADLTVTDNSGTQTMDVRKDKDKNYYAKTSAVDGIYKVNADLGDALDKSLDDFRSKKLFEFGFTEPSKVQFQNTTYEKKGEKWMSGSTEIDAISIQGLIDKLRDLAAAKFADRSAGAVVLELSVTANDPKNQPRTERVTITRDADKYFATRASEPGVYELDAKAVEDLQKAASAVKPAAAPKAPAKK